MRYALIDRTSGVVATMIVANDAFIARDPFVSIGRRVSDFAVLRIAYPADAAEVRDSAEVVTADCMSGSGWDDVARVFVRPEVGKRWDRAVRRMVDDPNYVAPPPTLEERVAALERTPPPEGATLEERIKALETQERTRT